MTTTQVEKRIVSAQIAAEQRQELERLAARGDRTLSAEVRRAIVRHLETSQGVSGGRRVSETMPAAGV